MHKTLQFIVVILISITSYSQSNTYFSYEVSSPKDKFDFDSNIALNSKDTLTTYKPARVGVAGFLLNQQLKDLFHLEVGIYLEYLGVDLIHDDAELEDPVIFSFSQNQLQFPFRFQAKHEVLEGRAQVVASLGANYVIDWFDKYTLDNYPTVNDKMLTVDSFSFKERYTLLEWGVGFDVKLFNDDFYLGLRYRENYNPGKILNIKVSTDKSTFNLKSRGNYTALVLSITYRISSFWNK